MQYFNEKLLKPLAGLSRREQGACLLIGVLGGMFPFPALTTIVTLSLCRAFGFVAAQTAVATFVNLLLTPFEVAAIPFLAIAGGYITGASTATFTTAHLYMSLQLGLMTLVQEAAGMLLHAILTWTIVSFGCLVLLRVASPK